MKTLNNFRFDNSFEEITIGQVTICAPSTAVYKMTLPVDTGTSGQVLTTDGNGVTSWTSGSVGSVTSVGYTATGLTGFTASGGPITGSGTLNLSYSGTAIPTLNGGTGVTGTSTGSAGVVLKTAPTISNLTTTGTTNMATLALTNALPVTSGGTGVTGTSTGSAGVVLKTAPTISDLTTTGTTNMNALSLTNDLAVTSGGTGVSTSTGTTNVVLSNSPTIDTLTLTGITNVAGNTFINGIGGAALYILQPGDTNHGLKYSNVGDNNGPDLFGFTRGQLSIQGTRTLSWDEDGVDVVEALTAKSLTLTTPLAITDGGTGGSTSTGTGILVLSENPYIRGDGAQKYVCQFQDDPNVNTSIAITTGEDDEAAIFFGTNFSNSKTGAHKNAIISAGIPNFSRASLHFCLNDDGNNSTSASLADSRLMIERGGNVGIGTVSPTSKLDVDGTITAPEFKINGALAATTIKTNSFSDWELTLPLNAGLGGQVLSTNGAGVCSWVTQPTEPGDGTVTSVGIVVPAFLSITNSPIITSGDMTIGLSGAALPVSSGGTGTTSVTGTGSLVLSASPTISGTSLSGVTGVMGNMFMNDNHIFLRNDAVHGIKWESDVDGPNIFGFDGGRLSSGGSGRMWWSPDGISTNDIDYFKYQEGTWTPDFTWLKGTAGVSTVNHTPTFTSSSRTANGQWVKIGKKVTLTWELSFTVDDVGTDDVLSNILFPCITGSGNVLPFRIKSGFRGSSNFEDAGFPNGWTGAGVPGIIAPVYPEPYSFSQIGNTGQQAFFQFFVAYGNWVSDGHRMPLFGTQNTYGVTISPPLYALFTSTGAPLSNQWFIGSGFVMNFNGSCTYFTD